MVAGFIVVLFHNVTASLMFHFLRKLPTRVQGVSLVSFAVLCAVTRGAVGTRGPTWDRSASPVTSWCTPTPSDHYEDQIHVRWDLGL